MGRAPSPSASTRSANTQKGRPASAPDLLDLLLLSRFQGHNLRNSGVLAERRCKQRPAAGCPAGSGGNRTRASSVSLRTMASSTSSSLTCAPQPSCHHCEHYALRCGARCRRSCRGRKVPPHELEFLLGVLGCHEGHCKARRRSAGASTHVGLMMPVRQPCWPRP